MAKDPFLEAGIAIPAELPYQDESQRENSARMVVGKGHQRHESVSCEHLQPELAAAVAAAAAATDTTTTVILSTNVQIR